MKVKVLIEVLENAGIDRMDIAVNGDSFPFDLVPSTALEETVRDIDIWTKEFFDRNRVN